jgi:polyhydroxybutyrate depolymerase
LNRAVALLLLFVVGALACGGGGESKPPAGTTNTTNTPIGTAAPPTGTAPPGPTTNPPGPPPGGWTSPVLPTTSPGCGAARGDAAGVGSTTAKGRGFHVWGPSGYDKTRAYPVVLMFHGIQTDGLGFQSWFKMEDYVNNEAFVVYADADRGYWDVDGDTDLLFFDDLVKQLGETYCINPSRVFGFGFSWGAFFVHHLGCNRAGYVHAIAAGEGGFGGSASSCGRLPVLITHRPADTNEILAHGEAAAAQWVTLDGCSATTTSDAAMNCTIHGACQAPGTPVTFCKDTSDMTGIPGYDPSWDHTVRETYRAFTWSWFKALP